MIHVPDAWKYAIGTEAAANEKQVAAKRDPVGRRCSWDIVPSPFNARTPTTV